MKARVKVDKHRAQSLSLSYCKRDANNPYFDTVQFGDAEYDRMMNYSDGLKWRMEVQVEF